MIIGACGFGETGSGVITDYLKEFDSITVKDNLEFNYVYQTDGLVDLERALMHPTGRTGGSIVAFKRFEDMVQRKAKLFQAQGMPSEVFLKSAKDFVESITMTKWYWSSGKISGSLYNPKYIVRRIMEKKVIPAIEKRNGHRTNIWPLEEVRFSVNPENFYSAAKKHMREVLRGIGLDSTKTIVLDQPFSGPNPQASFSFYDDPYAIVVDRDPRDLYVSGKTKLMGKWRFFPIESVDDFIVYYRCLRDGRPYKETHPRVLPLRFEELVYEYDSTTAKLRTFLHLPENPHPRTYFDPSLSIANTQVFKRYQQFAEDIKKIEDSLPEYLFDFSKYPEPDFSKEMFLWSPLNKVKRF